MKRLIILSVFLTLTVILGINAHAENADTVNIEYYDGEELLYVQSCRTGECAVPPDKEKTGYITRWLDVSGNAYDLRVPPSRDMTLYADYSLAPAAACVESVLFTYDGSSHTVSPSSLEHPLAHRGGQFSFAWYSSGTLITDARELSVKNVSDSGVYSLAVRFSYDGESVTTLVENINITVKKCNIKIPSIKKEKYTGELIAPSIPDNSLYKCEKVYASAVGVYNVELSLLDSENFAWDGAQSATVVVPFEIYKEISVPSVTEPDMNGEEGKAVNVTRLLFLLSGAFALFALLVYFIYKREMPQLAEQTSCASVASHDVPLSEDFDGEDSDCELTLQLGVVEEEKGESLSVSAERADSLISDSMAKNLIKRTDERIFTSGFSRCSVGLDKICECFSAGERVDIESMKARALVPSDTLRVFVEGRGFIDKPLRIYADGFSPCAVKMIVIAGGEAVRCRSIRRKK